MSAFLQNKFLQICPYGKQYLNNLVGECEKAMILAAVSAVTVVFLWSNLFGRVSDIYLLESVFLVLYLVFWEVPNYMFRETEDKLYKELLMYFSRVKHRYAACRNMTNAVVEAADGMLYEIQRLADEIYHVLMECGRKEKVREYIENHNENRYLSLFFIQAYEASEQGNLFFSENIEHLRLDLMEEIYRKRKRRHEFAGYSFVTVAPFFTMPVLKYWGLEFTPELEFFYSGTGVLLETITFLASLLIYRMILDAKEIVLSEGANKDTGEFVELIYEISYVKRVLWKLEQANGKFSKNVKKLILRSGERTSYGRICFQMIVVAISSCLILSVFFMEKRSRERELILGKVESIDTIAPVAGKEKKEILAEHILQVTRQCVQKKNPDQKEIESLLRSRIHLDNSNMEQEAVKEIQRKWEQYQKTKGFIGEAVFCILCSMGISLLPIFKMYYQIKIVDNGAECEVRQMQSVVLLERKIQGNTIIDLLEDMELFSRCFQSCLQRCINSYGMGAKKALLRLKEEGKLVHENFEELADAFLAVDDVGIETAFEEVESNRRLLNKMAQLDAEINMERKKDSTDLLSRIPVILAVGLYFIVPFFLHSLQGVFEVFELLENLQL